MAQAKAESTLVSVVKPLTAGRRSRLLRAARHVLATRKPDEAMTEWGAQVPPWLTEPERFELFALKLAEREFGHFRFPRSMDGIVLDGVALAEWARDVESVVSEALFSARADMALTFSRAGDDLRSTRSTRSTPTIA